MGRRSIRAEGEDEGEDEEQEGEQEHESNKPNKHSRFLMIHRRGDMRKAPQQHAASGQAPPAALEVVHANVGASAYARAIERAAAAPKPSANATSAAAEGHALEDAVEDAAQGVRDLLEHCEFLAPDKSDALDLLRQRWLDAVYADELGVRKQMQKELRKIVGRETLRKALADMEPEPDHQHLSAAMQHQQSHDY